MSFFSKWQTPVDEINSHQTELKQRSLGATSHMTDTHSAESNRQFVSMEREMIQYDPSPAECGKVLMLSNIVPFIQVKTGGRKKCAHSAISFHSSPTSQDESQGQRSFLAPCILHMCTYSHTNTSCAAGYTDGRNLSAPRNVSEVIYRSNISGCIRQLLCDKSMDGAAL